MKLRKLAVAIAALSAAGAMAAANTTADLSSQGDNSQVSQIQQALNDAGLNAGPVDGKLGPKTKSAVKQFQQQHGLQASGKLDSQTVAMLTNGSSASNASSNSNGSQPGYFSPQSKDTSGSMPSGNNGATASGNNGSTASGTNGSSSPSAGSPSSQPQDNGATNQPQQPSTSGRS